MNKKLLIKRIVLIMIVLFYCSKSWCQIPSHSLRGSLNDTTKITIEISYIKKANIKLLQYELLKKKILLKDSLIYLQNKKIEIYNNSYNEIKKQALHAQQLNIAIKQDLERAKKRNKIYGGVAGGLATSLLLFLIIK